MLETVKIKRSIELLNSGGFLELLSDPENENYDHHSLQDESFKATELIVDLFGVNHRSKQTKKVVVDLLQNQNQFKRITIMKFKR